MKAQINITDTMLNKSIIDANKSVCELAKKFSFDYSEAECGQKHLVLGKYTKLKHHTQAGDVVTLKGFRGAIKILINED